MQSEPTIRKNKSGYYEVRWSEKLENGDWRTRSISTRTTDLQEAEDFLKGWKLAQRQTATKADPTFKELAATYMKAGSARITTPGQRQNIKWLNEYLGDLTVPEIDAAVVAGYTEARATGELGTCPAKSSTIYKELTTLRTVLRYAEKTRAIPQGSAPHVDKPVRGQPREVWLDENEEVEFLALAASTSQGKKRMTRLHRFVYLALDTGARREAIESLRWDHVDLDAGLIHYARTDNRLTKKRRVAVPISERLMPILKKAHAEKTTDWVLDSAGDISIQFNRMVKGTKFEHIHPHDLRRTCGTLMARAGVPLWEICGVLGDSMEVATRHYLHHAPGHLRSAVNRKVNRQAPVKPAPDLDSDDLSMAFVNSCAATAAMPQSWHSLPECLDDLSTCGEF